MFALVPWNKRVNADWKTSNNPEERFHWLCCCGEEEIKDAFWRDGFRACRESLVDIVQVYQINLPLHSALGQPRQSLNIPIVIRFFAMNKQAADRIITETMGSAQNLVLDYLNKAEAIVSRDPSNDVAEGFLIPLLAEAAETRRRLEEEDKARVLHKARRKMMIVDTSEWGDFDPPEDDMHPRTGPTHAEKEVRYVNQKYDAVNPQGDEVTDPEVYVHCFQAEQIRQDDKGWHMFRGAYCKMTCELQQAHSDEIPHRLHLPRWTKDCQGGHVDQLKIIAKGLLERHTSGDLPFPSSMPAGWPFPEHWQEA